MSLRLRFNLVLTAVFLAGLLVSGLVSYDLLQRNAQAEVIHSANLMIEAAGAVRSYTVEKVRPHLADKLAEEFLPETVPAYAATEALSRLSEEYRGYVYKEATLNPTNPRDRAADWEADLIHAFRQDAGLGNLTGERETPNGPSLYVASPIRISDPACLTCHSTPAAAPASMIRRYGESNGFGWQLDEVVGAQIVSVPTMIAQSNADRAFLTFMLSLCGVFAAVYLAVNVMMTRMIIAPITRLSQAADAVSTGDFDIAEFPETKKDEIGKLGISFNRMRRSLEQAIKMMGP